MKLNNMSSKGITIDAGRRRFMKQSAILSTTTVTANVWGGVPIAFERGHTTPQGSHLATNTLGYTGQRRDPVTGCYHLGNGYRMYNPRLMRFQAADSMSPFGRGGINSYAYCLGDPINRQDPSGHFEIFSLIIGAIIGAVVGAAISGVAEGVRAATTGESFDWKQVGIGAALGFISGGFGAASTGAKTGVQVGLAVADAVISGGVDFGLNVAAGTPVEEAGINAGVGAAIGLATFGIGKGIGKVGKSVSAAKGRPTIDNLGGVNKSLMNSKSESLGIGARSYQALAKDYSVSSIGVKGHGAPGATLTPTGIFSGKDLAHSLPQNIQDSPPRLFELQSCYGATGGRISSQGQVLANELNTKVIAWRGLYRQRDRGNLGRSVVFNPQRPSRASRTNMLNKMQGDMSRLAMYIRHPSWL
jgi:RHS repeat-associated protein